MTQGLSMSLSRSDRHNHHADEVRAIATRPWQQNLSNKPRHHENPGLQACFSLDVVADPCRPSSRRATNKTARPEYPVRSRGGGCQSGTEEESSSRLMCSSYRRPCIAAGAADGRVGFHRLLANCSARTGGNCQRPTCTRQLRRNQDSSRPLRTQSLAQEWKEMGCDRIQPRTS